MLERASGQFTIDGNVEDIFGGISGMARIARISQTCRFTGVLEGESIGEYTAVLPREGEGRFQGFQRIAGVVGEREGSFVVSVSGEYARGLTRGTWSIVPKSGSGDFLYIRGEGSFSQSAGKPGSYKLEFDLRKPRKSRDAIASETTEANELIPGIDIVADEELVTEAVAAETQPLDEVVTAKPAQRSRPATAASQAAAAIMPEATTKRTRRKLEPLPVDPAPTALEVEAPPARKRSRTSKNEVALEQTPPAPVTTSASRSRKRSAPAIEQAAEEIVEPIKRAQKTKLPQVAAEAAAVIEPAPRRNRTRVQPPIEEIVVESAPAAEGPRKRGREPAAVEGTESAPASEPKPARRKKSVPPPQAPLLLPVAQEKPARQRKAKAA